MDRYITTAAMLVSSGSARGRYASLFPSYYIIIVCLYLSLSFFFPFLNPQQQKSHLTGRNSLDLFLILHYFFNCFQYFFLIFNILCFILLKILTFRRPCISNKNSTTLLYLKRNLTRSIPFFLLDLWFAASKSAGISYVTYILMIGCCCWTMCMQIQETTLNRTSRRREKCGTAAEKTWMVSSTKMWIYGLKLEIIS